MCRPGHELIGPHFERAVDILDQALVNSGAAALSLDAMQREYANRVRRAKAVATRFGVPLGRPSQYPFLYAALIGMLVDVDSGTDPLARLRRREAQRVVARAWGCYLLANELAHSEFAAVPVPRL